MTKQELFKRWYCPKHRCMVEATAIIYPESYTLTKEDAIEALASAGDML